MPPNDYYRMWVGPDRGNQRNRVSEVFARLFKKNCLLWNMFDMNSVKEKLGKPGAGKILVQIPEGLKMKAQEISLMLEKEGFMPIISVDPCFGACDLRDREAEMLGCEAVLHIGHSGIGLKTSLPVVYEEYRINFDPITVLRENINKLEGFRSIGLVSTVQYLDSLQKAEKYLSGRVH